MSSANNPAAAEIAARTIVTTRVFDAPRSLVFKAFSDPDRLAKWWGPKGFTNTFSQFELKPGGQWNFVMHGPDGKNYDNHSIFDEVVEPERIVFRHLDKDHAFQMTIIFGEEEQNHFGEAGKTRVTWHMCFDSAARCADLRSFVTDANEQNFDKLQAQIAEMSTRELSITRIINAPREKVFRCWTEPALITQWFTLSTWVTVSAEIDLRPGGSSLLTMRGPDGAEMANRDIYLEVVKNERLVLTDAYTSAWEPSERPFMTVILTFEDEGGKTRYTARVRHWSIADREAHEKMGFHQNWSISADQLAALAAKI